MYKTIHRESYIFQLERLRVVIEKTNGRIISDSDSLVYENANFFTKAFLVTMCAYIESYIKDVLMEVVDEFNRRLETIKLPHNLVKWSLNIEKNLKESELEYKHLKVSIKRKELDSFISGSPFKTEDLFKKFGINLERDVIFNVQREEINAIVVKRNNVLHHNDDASDVSNSDLIRYIKSITDYITNIDSLICKHLE